MKPSARQPTLAALPSVGLAEGDPSTAPFIYVSWRPTSRSRSCPASPACQAGRANLPITWGNDTLAVLPGTLGEAQLVERLRADAAVIESRPRRRRAVEGAGPAAVMSERGTMQDERILPLAQCYRPPAYFAG
jgi:precorrin-2/cobalt-factor-2 C20-methyltransferase